ncbi:hypothetical protein TeGR_g11946 [Tetraparma gracilis]|jgi:hypothetical protein|uniref:Uncharacterized protein n=1 Tax=Tetraparma gracilis TaxID=2962635 RepID=A0ABQ6MHS3_9STRA|nr:hypothetical protein TeGR_g11946 [Tetraparma gracilis]
MSAAAKVNALEAKRDQLLASQAQVSDQANAILTKKGGLNESSRMVRKNLQAAIAVAQQPGFFEYYQVNDECKSAEKQNELKKLTQNIKRFQKEIDQVNSEIAANQPKKSVPLAPNVSSFQQWFSQYGTPKPSPHGILTQIQDDPKIYGGTSHHAGFRTLSKQMRKGRCTR